MAWSEVIGRGIIRFATDGEANVSKSISSVAGNLVSLAIQYGVVRKAQQLFTESINAALYAQEVEQTLAFSLNKAYGETGIALGNMTQGYADWAASMQYKTKFDDESIKMAMSRLALMGAENTELERATIATMDFATANRMDLASAANIMSKAYGGYTTVLSRYNLTLEEGADIAQAVTDKWGGMAEMAGDTMAGKIEISKNAIGDLKEGLGQGIIESDLFQGAFSAMASEAESSGVSMATLIADKTKEVMNNIKMFVNSVWLGIIDVGIGAVKIFETIVENIWKVISSLISKLADGTAKLLKALPGNESLSGGLEGVARWLKDNQNIEGTASAALERHKADLEAVIGEQMDETARSGAESRYGKFLENLLGGDGDDEQTRSAGRGIGQTIVEEAGKVMGEKTWIDPKSEIWQKTGVGIGETVGKNISDAVKTILGVGESANKASNEIGTSYVIGADAGSEMMRGIAEVFQNQGANAGQILLNIIMNQLSSYLGTLGGGGFFGGMLGGLPGLLGSMMGGFSTGGGRGLATIPVNPNYMQKRAMRLNRGIR